MIRIACVMMHKDEDLLLRPWLLHHGYLFGFENLYVLDNGSSSDGVLAILQEFEALGVHVDRDHAEPQDFENRRALVGELIGEFRTQGSYDVALPLDCDEFVAIKGVNGIACDRTQILHEIERIAAGGVACQTEHCLENLPGYFDLYHYIDYARSILLVESFPDIEGSYWDGSLGSAGELGTTSLIYVHLAYQPFDFFMPHVQRKLEPHVDIGDAVALEGYEGPHAEIKPYLYMGSEEYYAADVAYPYPAVRFRGLTRFLEAVMDFGTTREVWQDGQPEELPPPLIELDLDATPFRPSDYLEANPSLPASGLDLFGHFLQAGYEAGFARNTSEAGLEEVVERLALLREKKRDGTSGYAGLFEVMSRVGRAHEVDDIMRAAVEEYGETEFLLREYALTAMYMDAIEAAPGRWDRYRELYPEKAEGYSFGALATLRSGKLNEAERLVLSGLKKFPKEIGLYLRLVYIARERGDWPRVKKLWDAVVKAAPDNPEVKDTAGPIMFGIRFWQDEQLAGAPPDAMDGPVVVNMTEEQTRAAIDFLGCKDAGEMRRFFMQFESLGHTCEFGLLQRRYGAEPIGLLRWNGISSRMLIQALEARFAGIDDPDNLKIQKANREYVLRDRTYFTEMHTFIFEGAHELDAVLAKQVKRMVFLRRKLLADLEAGEKIFVHLADGSLSREEIGELRRLVHGFGGGLLVYVQAAEVPSQAGTVEVADDGLLMGYIKWLGHLGHDWNIDFDSWLGVCRAVAQHRPIAPAVRPINPAVPQM